MNQELFYQYMEYEKDMPDLKEFTLCMWTKFHNHSDDHPLFSYSGWYFSFLLYPYVRSKYLLLKERASKLSF